MRSSSLGSESEIGYDPDGFQGLKLSSKAAHIPQLFESQTNEQTYESDPSHDLLPSQASEAGVCRGPDTPTIYVYPPRKKTNT